jgi:hypothetical protein
MLIRATKRLISRSTAYLPIHGASLEVDIALYADQLRIRKRPNDRHQALDFAPSAFWSEAVLDPSLAT